MPITQSYKCEICHLSVDDADLIADDTGALRRIEVSGGNTTRPVAGTPRTVEQRNYPVLIFCSYAHVALWVDNQTF